MYLVGAALIPEATFRAERVEKSHVLSLCSLLPFRPASSQPPQTVRFLPAQDGRKRLVLLASSLVFINDQSAF